MERRLRELADDDIPRVVGYFRDAAPEFLVGMGVDRAKLPAREEWQRIIRDDLERPLETRQFYYLIWEVDGTPIGHSNINKIVFGWDACMHLHIWHAAARRSGHGLQFIRESITRYFERFRLQNILCEPYARNPAPNRILAKIGFEHVRTYATTPGWINFPQTVNRWVLTRENWRHG
ncbi:MAG: GNAT family protein [Desulfobacterales bacterium]|nr:GNAT family protein [Desulfobacterales bacterium]